MSSPLRIVILHYHLRRGGVSKVIQYACRALEERDVKICILAGEGTSEESGAPVCVVPELGYGKRAKDAEGLAEQLKTQARKELGGTPDIWHIHNHSLGKNLVLPLLVDALVRNGENIVLQPHDFAEDCRPVNYGYLREGLGDGFPEKMYPCSERIHYAVLNPRDRDFLAAAGAPEEALHMLPNPVDDAGGDEKIPGAEVNLPSGRLYLYPTRGIRRKNLGEVLFWSAMAADDEWFGITLAPQNPVEQPLYHRWQKLVTELDLPVWFELGNRYDLSELYSASECVVNTSLAEGYGMVFLEPWMARRTLVGRDLPETTRGFTSLGMDLNSCYERIDIPVDTVGRERLEHKLLRRRGAMLASFGKQTSATDNEKTLSNAIENGKVDFGALGEDLQTEVLRRVADSPGLKEELQLDLGSGLDQEVVAGNREVIKRELNLAKYGKRLMGIYEAVLGGEPGKVDYLDSERILNSFLQPSRFRMLLVP